MCIQKIDPSVKQHFKINGRGEVVAWKVFKQTRNLLSPDFVFANGWSGGNESKWYTDDEGIIRKSYFGGKTDVPYPRGFHAFATKKRAEEWKENGITRISLVIRRVLLRGNMTFGLITNQPAVAATRMYICKGEPKEQASS